MVIQEMMMKKIRVSTATNEQLNWLVAIIEFPPGAYGGAAEHYSGNRNERWTRIPNKAERCYDLARYTTNPTQMWPIMERERVCVLNWDHNTGLYTAENMKPYSPCAQGQGKTQLVAGARCYVVSKLGEEVEVPEELK